MKNTSMKKKALLSSVAMLLVALVALGSATFAWFYANPTVTATGLAINATTSAGLQIKTESDNEWKQAAELNKGGTSVSLQRPASLDYNAVATAANFYTTTAAAEDNYAAADITKATAATAARTGTLDVYAEKIYLRSSVSGQTADVLSATVKINGTSKALTPTVRVVLYDDTAKSVIGTWSTVSATNKYIKNSSGSYSLADGTATSASEAKVSMSKTVDYTGDKAITAYVFIDGEDQACKTSNVVNLEDLISSIVVTFSTNA